MVVFCCALAGGSNASARQHEGRSKRGQTKFEHANLLSVAGNHGLVGWVERSEPNAPRPCWVS